MSSVAGADEFDRRLALWRSEQLSSLDLRALAWLGVAPVWTDALAAAARFPADDLDQFLQSAESAGWVTVFRDRFSNDRSFFVKERRRADVITQCRSGGVQVEEVLQQASTGLRRAQSDVDLPHLDAAWLGLLDSAGRDRLPETMYAQVDAL